MTAEAASSDLATVFQVLRKYRWLMACVTILTTSLGAFVAFTSAPIYRARIVVVPVEPQSGSGGALSRIASQIGALGSLADLGLSGMGGSRDESHGVLQSRQLLYDFIAEKDLIPILYPDRWDAESGQWSVPLDEVPSLPQAVEFFESEVRRIEEDQRSGRVALLVEWRDPVLAAAWANDLVARANEELRNRAIASSELSIKYLQEQLSSIGVLELRQSLNAAIQAQLSTAMMARARPDFALRVIDTAIVPDRRDPVKPRKALLILAASLAGLFLSGGIAISLAVTRRFLRANPESVD